MWRIMENVMAKRTVSNTKTTKKQKSRGTLIIKKGSRKFRVEDRGGCSVYWCLCDDCRAEKATWR